MRVNLGSFQRIMSGPLSMASVVVAFALSAAMVLGAQASAGVSAAPLAHARSASGWAPTVEIGGETQNDSVGVQYPLFEGPSMTVDPLGPVSIATSACSPYKGQYGLSCEPPGGGLLTYASSSHGWKKTGHLRDAAWQDTPLGDPYMITSGSNGHQVIVYMGCTSVNPAGSSCELNSQYDTFAVFARRRVSGTSAWSHPIQISPADSGSYPEVVVDKHGNASILWGTGGSPLAARELKADGTLGPVQLVAGTQSDNLWIGQFSLAGDSHGHAVVAMYYNNTATGETGIKVSTLSGDWSTTTGPTWSRPTTMISQMPGGSTGELDPIAAVGTNGQGVVGWQYSWSSDTTSTVDLQVRMQNSHGRWGKAQTVPRSRGPLVLTGQGETCAPRLARDDAGDLIMAWEKSSPTVQLGYSTMVARLPAGASSWSTKTLASWAPSSGSQESGGGCADVAMNGEGDAVVDWNSEVDGKPVQVKAAVAPAGKAFGAPHVLNDDSVESPVPYNNSYQDLLPASAVIDSHGIATVAWVGRDIDSNPLLMAARTTTRLDGKDTLKVKVTTTSGTTWGDVTVSYKSGGKMKLVGHCNTVSCTFHPPHMVVLYLKETAKNESTWPFKNWAITNGGKTTTKTGDKLVFEISGKQATVQAVYVFK